MLYSVAVFAPLAGALVAGLLGPAIGDRAAELATILGMIPMALALEAGSEQYAPLARAIIGGLTVSVIVTVYVVPAAYLWVHRNEEDPTPAATEVA